MRSSVLAVVGIVVSACSSALPSAEHRVVVVESTVCSILQPVVFARGERGAETPDGIDAIANVLRREPNGIVLVEIAGHGSPDEDAALELSRRRADWVRDELVRRGVDPAKLRSRGYGHLCPVDDANAPANRRVEMKIVATEAGPTGVEIGCPAASAAGVGAE